MCYLFATDGWSARRAAGSKARSLREMTTVRGVSKQAGLTAGNDVGGGLQGDEGAVGLTQVHPVDESALGALLLLVLRQSDPPLHVGVTQFEDADAVNPANRPVLLSQKDWSQS